jgi:phage terminase small subunit
MALTPKQKRFCDEYLIDLNATQAAIRAGYSERTAYRTGADNLKKPQIQECISKSQNDREKRTEITQDMVVKELAAIAFQKVSDYAHVVEKEAFAEIEGRRIPLCDSNGEPVMVQTVELTLTDKLTDNQIKAIAGIKQGRNGVEVNTCGKEKALELLGRHLGMFTDKVELTGIEEQKVKLDGILKQLSDD